MNETLKQFAGIGASLFYIVVWLAKQTKGSFPPGPASITLAMAVAFGEAARNAFLAMAAAPGVSTTDRAVMQQVASEFRRGLGVVAVYMPGPRGVAAVASTAPLSKPGGGLAQFFVGTAAVPVSVSAAAQAALDALRRDPLVLAAEGPEPVMRLVSAVVDGVAVAQ